VGTTQGGIISILAGLISLSYLSGLLLNMSNSHRDVFDHNELANRYEGEDETIYLRNSSMIPSLRMHLLDSEDIDEKLRVKDIDPIIFDKRGGLKLNLTEAKKYFEVIMIQKRGDRYQIEDFRECDMQDFLDLDI
jgi:hypothetical protein